MSKMFEEYVLTYQFALHYASFFDFAQAAGECSRIFFEFELPRKAYFSRSLKKLPFLHLNYLIRQFEYNCAFY